MKKNVFLIFLFGIIQLSHAQVRVCTNGNLSIKSDSLPLSTISIGFEGVKPFHVSTSGDTGGYFAKLTGGGYNWGYASSFTSLVNSQNNFSVGLISNAGAADMKDQYWGRAFGVFANAGNASSGWNYAIFGRIRGTRKGAAVYGTVDENENGIYLTDRYAGYFNGPVGITGNLEVKGNIKGVFLGESVSSNHSVNVQSQEMASQTSVVDNFSKLSAIPYYKEIDEPCVLSDNSYHADTLTEVRQMNTIEAQNLSKQHFALSADLLSEIYPDLVYTNEDGTKSINYMELIPLLVQSINELNAKIEVLENTLSNNTKKAVSAVHSSVTKQETASLSQNTPNPFNQSTVVTVGIPASAKDASVIICDMNGKQIKKLPVTRRGIFKIQISSEDLYKGMFLYSLIIDGQVVNTKRMIVTQ